MGNVIMTGLLSVPRVNSPPQDMNRETQPPMGAAYFLPQWGLQAQGVRVQLSTRDGVISSGAHQFMHSGVSEHVYARMNLGLHVGDDPNRVLANRRLYAQYLGATPVFLNQVHGTRVIELGRGDRGLQTQLLAHDEPFVQGATESADAAWTSRPGVACTMMVADCMPLLLADSMGRAVAAVHVGWRGLVGLEDMNGKPQLHSQGGVVTQTIEVVRHYLQDPNSPEPVSAARPELCAWMGPCIGPSAFEVGPEVREWFLSRHEDNACAFTPSAHTQGHWMCHLPWLVALELERAKVLRLYGNLTNAQDPWRGTRVPGFAVDPWCTFTHREYFFSYRREGPCGRFAASIWLDQAGCAADLDSGG
jgi:polyphenol oxidase